MSLVRNEVFVGLPFFLLGDYLFQKKDGIVSSLSKKGILTGMIPILIVTTILENQFLAARGLTTEMEQGVSTILLALILFVLFMKQNGRAGGMLHWFARIGKQYSTMIYVIHPAFLNLFSLLLDKAYPASGNAMEIYRWIAPILIFSMSLGFAVLHEKVKALLIVHR